MSLLGIDIGTSRCKATVFSNEGTVLCSDVENYQIIKSKESLFETDCALMEQAIFSSIKKVASKENWIAKYRKEEIMGIACASFGETMIPIDAKGNVLGNGIFSYDKRGKEYIKNISSFGEKEWYKINRNIAGYEYSFPKLVWYKEKNRDLYDKIDTFLLWADFIVFKLTGQKFTNNSLASRTQLFDLEKNYWATELFNYSGLDINKFAPIIQSGKTVGRIKSEMALKLGLNDNVIVCSGLHDQEANALGVGAISGGSSVSGIGSVECTAVVFDGVPNQKWTYDLGLGIEPHVVQGKTVALIYNQAGTLMTWFINTFCKDLLMKGYDEKKIFEVLIEEAPKNPTNICFYPFIEPCGAPLFLNDGNGCFMGINNQTNRGVLYRSILEGETYYFKDVFNSLMKKGLNIDSFIATGGGSKDKLWMQIKADILGLTVKKSKYTQTGTVGCAIAAGVASGVYENYEEGVSFFQSREDETYFPNKENNDFYNKFFKNYLLGLDFIKKINKKNGDN